MAACAYDVAAMSLRGSSAHLNFPELASSLPKPASLSPRDIQSAAAAAATAWQNTVPEQSAERLDRRGLGGEQGRCNVGEELQQGTQGGDGPDISNVCEEGLHHDTTLAGISDDLFDDDLVRYVFAADTAEAMLIETPPHAAGGGLGQGIDHDHDHEEEENECGGWEEFWLWDH